MANDLLIIETMISEALQQAIGDPMTAGLITLFLFIIIMAVLKLDLSVALIILVPLIFVLAAAGLFEWWVMLFVLFAMGIIIWLAIKKASLTQR